MPSPVVKQRLFRLAKEVQQERSRRRQVQAQVEALSTTLRRLPRPRTTPVRQGRSKRHTVRPATAHSTAHSSVSSRVTLRSGSATHSGHRLRRSQSSRSHQVRRSHSGHRTRDSRAQHNRQGRKVAEHFQGTSSSNWPPKRFLNGQEYYGRTWCDLTRAMEYGTHPRPDNTQEHGYYPRQSSNMSRAVINYMCKLQSPYTRIPPKPGKPLGRQRCDMVRHGESIAWSLRNRYTPTAKK